MPLKNTLTPVNTFTPAYFHTLSFAHLGRTKNGPSNTKKSIQATYENGVKAIGIDIQLTSDNHLVLFHDAQICNLLDDCCNLTVASVTLDEIRSVPLKDYSQGTQYVSTLSEILDYLKIQHDTLGYCDFVLEMNLKHFDGSSDQMVQELNKILDKYDDAFGKKIYNHVFVSTTSLSVITSLRKRNSKLKFSLSLIKGAAHKRIFTNAARLCAYFIAGIFKADIIQFNRALASPQYINRWKKRGYLVQVYDVNTASDIIFLRNQKVAYTYH